MAKVGIIVLADKETHADMGRVSNALATVKDFQEAGDAVTLLSSPSSSVRESTFTPLPTHRSLLLGATCDQEFEIAL